MIAGGRNSSARSLSRRSRSSIAATSPPAEMRGPWAGELGQVQFLPTHYFDYGVDFDGDGQRQHAEELGRRARLGGQLSEEPRLAARRAVAAGGAGARRPAVGAGRHHDQAAASQWAAWGVTLAGGKPLPDEGRRASLLLPMGRNGPAFLAYPNFDVYLEWNNSLVYSTTAAYFATRLAGRRAGQPRQRRSICLSVGGDQGGADSSSPSAATTSARSTASSALQTRAAVKDVQMKLGLPADSYPSTELLAKLAR